MIKKIESQKIQARFDYLYDHSRSVDQKEALTELLILADWSAKSRWTKQSDSLQELIAYARDASEVLKNG